MPDDPDGAYDFEPGAGFYVDTTQQPWATNYRMRSYIEAELPALIAEHFPADMIRQGLMGHLMGGHGAHTIALRTPIASQRLRLRAQRRADAGLQPVASSLRSVALIEDGAHVPELLVDQGRGGSFLPEQLRAGLLDGACKVAGIPLMLRLQPGYDHSYYFISTFMADHLRWHAARLAG